MFNRFGKSYRMDMDRIARVASNLRDGSAIYANGPGTARALAQLGGWSASAATAASTLYTGNVGLLGVVLGSIAGFNGAARLMTSPTFVRWLAKSTSVPKGAIPAQLAELRQIGEKEGDDDMVQFADQLDAQRGTGQ